MADGTKNFKWWHWLLLIGCLLYLVWPIDAIPDVVPIVGWLDDVGVALATVGIIYLDVAT